MTSIVLGAMAIGLTLGLLGSGGSILTVPVLTFLVGQDEKVAIAGSLAIVGLISAVAAVPYIRKKSVDWRTVVYFGIPGMVGTYGGAWLASFVSGTTQLLAFSGVMVFAAWKMLKPAPAKTCASGTRPYWQILVDGLLVGVITGFVGVGGGFLVVPALVLLGGLPMQRAVATSLVIIAMKSASGFYKYQDVLAQLELSLDWSVIGLISVVGVLGSLLGGRLGQQIPQAYLKQAFGMFLVVMAGYILWQSAPVLIHA